MEQLRSILRQISNVWKASWLGKIAVLIGSSIFFGCCCIAATAAIPGDTPAAPDEPTTVEATDEPEPTTQPPPTESPTVTTQLTETPHLTASDLNSSIGAALAPDGQEVATVVNIVDGDTIDVAMGGTTYRVRYIGVNTPEVGQPCAAEATDLNASLVSGQTVTMVKDVSETDRYDRLLRYVYVGDLFVNAELVAQGYAQAATYPPDVAHTDLFVQLQGEAQAAGRGCWAPVPAPETTSGDSSSSVQITYVLADGAVPRVESDEYAVITNQGETSVNLEGWHLNADDPGQDFWFPAFELAPGQSCRVYTDQNHPEHCGFSFGYGRAIWNNGGDCGHLYDASGAEVSTYCYP